MADKDVCNNGSYCLNTKKTQKFLVQYITNLINGKTQYLPQDFGFYLTNKNYIFKLTPEIKQKKAVVYLLINQENNTTPCLRIKLFKKYLHEKDKVFYFQKSKIEQITRGICGIVNRKINLTLDGTYITKLADLLNQIFRVEESHLDDDARLEICNTPIRLKTIKLLTEGQTWYQKVIGFELVDKNIYTLAENIANTKYEYLYNIILNNPRDSLSGDIIAVKEEDLNNTLEVLTKFNLSRNNTLREIAKTVFETKSNNPCDVATIYKFVFNLPNRNKVYNDPNYQTFKDYVDFQKAMYNLNDSVKFYQY